MTMRFINSRLNPSGVERLFRIEPDRPLAMLRLCPAYAATPLQLMPEFAAGLGIGALMVKDETQRMRLGSFKALGGVFAVAQMIEDASGASDLNSEHARQTAANMTFITASAGNHGLSVAAGAHIFGARGIIVLSSAVPEGFAERIRNTGAEVVRVDGSYEDSVRYAVDAADRNGWLLLADGSWEGYTERPALVMEGYSVIADECRAKFVKTRDWPTHVFVQAGVGGLAAAMAAHIRQHWPAQPQIIVVEPDAAPCLLQSAKAGILLRAEGPQSNMGRLDCKDASLIAFEALRHDADLFMTVSDTDAKAATRQFASHGIQTTPSGAAPLAALQELDPGPEARCLLIATEGPETA
ncbi:diaminopropionate ammonia-lyase [Hoeflea sp. YIM 152468]|uniref:diaminopropionate ammonia-lyase n=1 Tax=Hoeflea sp. YIM 152468 TaxID=3031759 RepID=UPI0023DA16D6|nr:diaminopropionate ammonia-lyase [Hoeflea sp. YIM 152468]MDF1607679.1 diaminopropionate ammonia-lyase [Hoeflea sp. YIM 152468]